MIPRSRPRRSTRPFIEDDVSFFAILEEIDSAKMQEYQNPVFPVVAQSGGKYLVIGRPLDAVEGSWRPAFPVLIEFPSLEQAQAQHTSEEYRELKKLRLTATKGHAVFMAGTAIWIVSAVG